MCVDAGLPLLQLSAVPRTWRGHPKWFPSMAARHRYTVHPLNHDASIPNLDGCLHLLAAVLAFVRALVKRLS